MRLVDKRWKLTPEQVSVVYRLIENAVLATDPSGKSTDEVFGEIFTRFRTDIALYGQHESMKRLFCTRLKALNGTDIGDQLNDIINEIYQEKVINQNTFLDLELCTTVMDDCLREAKEVGKESVEVMSNLNKIDEQLDGGNNV